AASPASCGAASSASALRSCASSPRCTASRRTHCSGCSAARRACCFGPRTPRPSSPRRPWVAVSASTSRLLSRHGRACRMKAGSPTMRMPHCRSGRSEQGAYRGLEAGEGGGIGRRGLEQQHRVAQPRRADEAAARAQAVQDRGRTGDVARPQRACHRLGLRRQFRQEQAPQALNMAGVAVERFQRASLVPVAAALAEQAPQGLAQRGGGQRLGHHRIEASGAQVFEHLRVVRRGVCQRRRVRMAGAQLRQQGRAVAVAELRVQQPQVECFAGGERLRLRASRRLGDPRGQGGRGRRQEGAAGRIVLDQQYAWRHRWPQAPRYAALMSAWRLPTLALLSALAATVAAWPVPGRAQARVADASIARVVTAVATLEGVRVRLAWVPGADSGELSVHAARVDATDLGYRYRDLAWRCPLQRLGDGWRCDGTVRSGNGAPLRLTVAFTGDDTDALLASGNRRLSLHRDAATPDDTRIDLLAVPATWAQALLAQAWEAGRL